MLAAIRFAACQDECFYNAEFQALGRLVNDSLPLCFSIQTCIYYTDSLFQVSLVLHIVYFTLTMVNAHVKHGQMIK